MEQHGHPEAVDLTDSEAASFERDAAVAFDHLLATKRKAGRTYPILDASNRVVFVHPDGTIDGRRAKPVQVIA